MAVARLKKIFIFSPNNFKDELLTYLEDLGVFHLTEIKEKNISQTLEEFSHPSVELDIRELDSQLTRIDAALQLFAERERDAKFKRSPKKIHLKKEEFRRTIEESSYIELCQRLESLRDSLCMTVLEKVRWMEEARKILPWKDLDLELKDFQGLEMIDVIWGKIDESRLGPLFTELLKEKLNFSSFEVDKIGKEEFFIFFILKEEQERASLILKKYNFTFVDLGTYKEKPKDVLRELEQKISSLARQERELNDRVLSLLPEKTKLLIWYDYLNSIRWKKLLAKFFAHTKKVAILEGWIKEKDLNQFRDRLRQVFPLAEIFTREPSLEDKEELVPVALENKPLFRPFEFVTKVYGLPKYGELDPTPILAPFFFLFFGLCLTDAGYGIILCLFSLCFLKKFRLSEEIENLLKLLFLGGISTIILGAFTGGWFGNAVDLLAQYNKNFLGIKKIKDSLIVLNPSQEPLKLLIFALGLGALQICFGNVVAFLDNLRKKNFAAAVLDQVSSLVFIGGLLGMVLSSLDLLEKSYRGFFSNLILFSSLVILFTGGRQEKGLFSRLFQGGYRLYNTAAGLLSDNLSYCRLWALGLVTAVMAVSCNSFALSFSQSFPEMFSLFLPFLRIKGIKIFSAVVIFILIFILGHILTIAVNVLGALIHTGRLQYVEFFPKFFRSGGKPFRPLRFETRFTVIE